MLRDGIIRVPKSPYNSTLCLVHKNSSPMGEKQFRVVVHYKTLNGFKNAPAIFQRMIDDILKAFIGKIC